PARVLADLPFGIACVTGSRVMQGVVGKIMPRFDGCGPVGLVVDEIKAEFVVPPPRIDPPGTINPPLGHQWNGETDLTPQRIVTADGKGGNPVVFPFT